MRAVFFFFSSFSSFPSSILFSFSPLYYPGSLVLFFPFFSCTLQVSNHLPFAYLSLISLSSTPLQYEVQLRIIPGKFIHITKNLHYNFLFHLFNAYFTLHENMHWHFFIIGSQVNKSRGGSNLFVSPSGFNLSQSLQLLPVALRLLSTYIYKLCKILAVHDQCIQWCEEHNLLASSIMCPLENCSNTSSWTRRASSRDGYERRCLRRECNGMASMRQNSWFSTSKNLVESYQQEWLWRQDYGDDLFGNIIKHIADLYEVHKDA